MDHVLIVGGGLSGCTAAKELSGGGMRVTIVEATDRIGGKVRGYGCKAAEACSNCGVCLAAGLWGEVGKGGGIEIATGSRLIDLSGGKGDFTAAIKGPEGVRYIPGITEVIVAAGFEAAPLDGFNGFAELGGSGGGGTGSGGGRADGSGVGGGLCGAGRVITGSELEKLFAGREAGRLFAEPPAGVAFVQCYGSRDCKEGALYCSRVCCAYSARAAKAIRHYYPECRIVFYYMELQQVGGGSIFQELKDTGVEFVRCRPVRLDASAGAVAYDDPGTGKREERRFDIVVLSDGIRPAADADRLAEICGLSQDVTGFLKYTRGPAEARATGVYLAGCVSGPKRIEEAHAEAVAVAQELLRQ